MATSLGTGLAIGGTASLVVVAGVTAYLTVREPSPAERSVTLQENTVLTLQTEEKKVELPSEPVDVVAEPDNMIAEPVDTAAVPIEETLPSLDVVRVDKAGAAVIAGNAAANSEVDILVDGQVIATTQADESGAFVSLLDIEPSDVPRELELAQKLNEEDVVLSDDKVLVMPFEPEADAAPDLIIAKPEGVKVISEPKAVKIEPEVKPVEIVVTGAEIEVETVEIEIAKVDVEAEIEIEIEPTEAEIEIEPKVTKVEPEAEPVEIGMKTAEVEDIATEILSLDTIVYDDLGDVVISGRGNSSDFVRVYLDNKPTEIQKIPNDGQWQISLTDVPDGIYALRVDSVDPSGAVTERVQSPFKRETAEDVVTSTEAKATNVTIQPGFTLWALAESKYGNGRRYVQIFEANREHIQNPDLIYPGQIFDLPN